VNGYIGIPYLVNGRDRSGLDCWGLVVLVFREQRGIVLPDWQMDVELAPSLRHIVRMIAAKRVDSARARRAERIEAPEPWAIVISERKSSAYHAGLCVDANYILHASAAGVVCPRAQQFNGLYGDRSYWRWQV
jgi:hypothetical protein